MLPGLCLLQEDGKNQGCSCAVCQNVEQSLSVALFVLSGQVTGLSSQLNLRLQQDVFQLKLAWGKRPRSFLVACLSFEFGISFPGYSLCIQNPLWIQNPGSKSWGTYVILKVEIVQCIIHQEGFTGLTRVHSF